jgi:hypothetical protein
MFELHMTTDSKFFPTFSSVVRATLRRTARVLKYCGRAKLGRVPPLGTFSGRPGRIFHAV